MTRMINWVKRNKPESILIFGILSFIAYFTVYTFLRQTHYLTAYYDLGIMDQVIWNTAHGRFFLLTAPNGVPTVSRFAIHADIFMVLLAPLYWIWDSIYMLILAQVVIVALGALPLYWLGRDVLKNKKIALIIALAYLLFGPLERAVIFDFHAVTLSASLFIFAFYYLYKQKYWPFVIFAILAVSTKETMTFLTMTMGLYVIFVQKKWKIGLAVVIASALWFYLLLWHIMPAARPDRSAHFALDYYAKYGLSPSKIVKTILTKPFVWLPDILNKSGLRYLLIFLVPTGLLALFTPFLLLALPEFMINLLSNDPLMRMIGFQYVAAITAFTFIAFVLGVAGFQRVMIKLSSRYPSITVKKVEKFLIYYLVIVTIVSTYVLSPLPGMFRADVKVFNSSTINNTYINELSREIPPDARVAATNKLAPHFSHREHIYYFPNGLDRTDYVVAQTGVGENMNFLSPETQGEVEALATDSRFELIHKDETLVVYKRK